MTRRSRLSLCSKETFVNSLRLTARTRRLGSLAGLLWVLAGCGADPVSPLTPADVVGTYALQSINGHALPAPFGQGTTIIYDTMVVARDSTFAGRNGGGVLGSNVVTDSGTYAGRWTLDAAGGQLVTTTPLPHAVEETLTFTVVNRGTSLTFNAGPVDPSNPGGGLWVYNRVR